MTRHTTNHRLTRTTLNHLIRTEPVQQGQAVPERQIRHIEVAYFAQDIQVTKASKQSVGGVVQLDEGAVIPYDME